MENKNKFFESIDDTLFIIKHGIYLRKHESCIAVENNNEIIAQFPVHMISNIIINEFCKMSSEIIKFCSENDTNIFIVNKYNYIVSSLNNFNMKNYNLKKRHFMRIMDKNYCLKFSKSIISGKIENSCYLLKTCANNIREKTISDKILEKVNLLKQSVDLVNSSKTIESVRGYEGDAARLYFSILPKTFYKHEKEFIFDKRSYNPPENELNSLLSFCYSLLLKDCIHACCFCNLDPSLGFMHANSSNKPSLALDLMEEFRSIISDRLVVTLINKKIITIDDFNKNKINKKAKKNIINSYLTRKNKIVQYKSRKIPTKLLFYLRAKELSKCIKNSEIYKSYSYRRDSICTF